MSEELLRLYVRVRSLAGRLVRDESGEGVISAAIAVLIMAALGALMWVGFKQIWTDASTQTSNHINQIGQ